MGIRIANISHGKLVVSLVMESRHICGAYVVS